MRNAQVVQLVRPTTLLELLAVSGGVADDAGAVVLVVRRSPVALLLPKLARYFIKPDNDLALMLFEKSLYQGASK